MVQVKVVKRENMKFDDKKRIFLQLGNLIHFSALTLQVQQTFATSTVKSSSTMERYVALALQYQLPSQQHQQRQQLQLQPPLCLPMLQHQM